MGEISKLKYAPENVLKNQLMIHTLQHTWCARDAVLSKHALFVLAFIELRQITFKLR